jgi:hypothetical protein
MANGIIPESDKGRPQANSPVSVAPHNAQLSGRNRMTSKNFVINSRNQFNIPESYMASNAGSVRQV